MKRRLFLLSAVLVLALALSACGAKGTMNAEPNEETGGVNVVCERAGDGTAVNGYVTIEEGQCLVLSPNLEKGSIQVRAILMEREATTEDLGTADEAALDETVDGQVMTTYDLEPGEYMLAFISKDNPTGTMIAMPYSIQEMQEQNDKLEEAMVEAVGPLAETAEQ